MYIYTKLVNGVRKIYGNLTHEYPTASDTELTYQPTLTDNDSYVDGGSSNNVKRIKRKSDSSLVKVFVNGTQIIGDVTTAETPNPTEATPKVATAKATKKSSSKK